MDPENGFLMLAENDQITLGSLGHGRPGGGSVMLWWCVAAA
jgi:hypothetical protein